MTKRLTPEEDAEAIRGLGGCDTLSYPGDAQGGFPFVQIDKRKYEMEITREGERFLEVRFKRRESVPLAHSTAALEGYARHRQECAEYYDELLINDGTAGQWGSLKS